MISAASNCCRVDAVKASANTLRQQLAQHARGTNDRALQTAEQQLQSVDQQVRANNANQAEVALSSARLSVEKLDYAKSVSASSTHSTVFPHYGTTNLYA